MTEVLNQWQSFDTFVRWRPLTRSEKIKGEMHRSKKQEDNSLYSVAITQPAQRPWKSAAAFKDTFEPLDNNLKVYENVVSEAIAKVLQGASCNFFAYGHSGSGKTHTIIGYDYEHDDKLGLCLAAARRLFDALNEVNEGEVEHKLGVGFSLFELRKNIAFDLLNGRTQCYIRQGADGKTHIRGETEILEDGKVRVKPIMQRPCWTFQELRQQLEESLGLRAVGSSSIHDQSSRTHAVLELEIVNIPLMEARGALYDRQAELVPVGKHATDVVVEEGTKANIRGPDGVTRPNPNYSSNQARIDEAVGEQRKFEARITVAEEHIDHILSSSEGSPACLGGKLVFIDLAGSEYQDAKGGSQSQLARQTPQERQEGRQINTDLLALKEVIRACSTNQSRIPFRSSPLTMVLRDHFMRSKNGSSAMIVTVSPAQEQYPATLNSLKYGSLVGAASARLTVGGA